MGVPVPIGVCCIRQTCEKNYLDCISIIFIVSLGRGVPALDLLLASHSVQLLRGDLYDENKYIL